MKNTLIGPLTLTFQPLNHITYRISQGHSLYQDPTLWDHSFSMLQTNRQTNKQMEPNILLMPTNSVSMGNNNNNNTIVFFIWHEV